MFAARVRQRITWIALPEDGLPGVLHVHDRPAFGIGLVKSLVEPSDVGGTVVGPLTLGIGVMDEPHEPRPTSCGSPLQHLLITVRIAESEDRAPTDEPVDADRLAGAVVDEFDLGFLHKHRLT